MCRGSKSIGAAWVMVFALLAHLTTGCGSNTSGDGFTGERGQVSGTITLDGQPLEKGCQALFIAEKGGYTASGAVADQGHYAIVYKDKKGLPVGDYKIQISPPVAATADATKTVDPVKMASQRKLQSGSQAPTDSGPVPLKYRSTDTSGLRYKIEAGQNTADFKLEKK